MDPRLDRRIAEEVTAAAGVIDGQLGHMVELLRNERSAELRHKLVDAVFRLISQMHDTVVVPIAKVYPDLHPDDPERFLNLPHDQREP